MDIFKLFLDAASDVHSRISWEVGSPYEMVHRYRTKRGKYVKLLKRDVGKAAAEKLRYRTEPVPFPEKKEFARMRDAAWKVVTGQTYNQYWRNHRRVSLGKLHGKYGEDAVKALMAMVYGNIMPHAEWEPLLARWKESPNATFITLASSHGHKLHEDDIFKKMKEYYREEGVSKGDWKWLMSRPLYQIVLMRRCGYAGAANLRLRPTLMKNWQIQRILRVRPTALRRILKNEIANLQGPMCRYMPFEDFNGRSRDLDVCIDFCRFNENIHSTTFRGLLRAANEWHETRMSMRGQSVSIENNLEVMEIDGYVFTPLKETNDIIKEGIDQHHCVGAYAEMCVKGNYAVVKIEGKERATLGLSASKDGWRFSQCYGACNEYVSDATMKAVSTYMTRNK